MPAQNAAQSQPGYGGDADLGEGRGRLIFGRLPGCSLIHGVAPRCVHCGRESQSYIRSRSARRSPFVYRRIRSGEPTWESPQANGFPRQTNGLGQAGSDHPSSRTDPDDPGRLTGIYGSAPDTASAAPYRRVNATSATAASAVPIYGLEGREHTGGSVGVLRVSSPEPAAGVFTTAGTCQGRLRRHFVINAASLALRASRQPGRVTFGLRVVGCPGECGGAPVDRGIATSPSILYRSSVE